jgi:DNA-binding response OmpR family regulator
VGTAAEAISSTQTERFDLYVVDSQLTDLDGFDLCRRIRDVDPDTPILFFSGAADEADRKRGIAAGANDYVIKPDLDGLLGSIKRFISGAESAPAKVIPFGRKANSSDFTFEPAA